MCGWTEGLYICVRQDRKFQPFTSVSSKRETVNLHVNSCVVNIVLFAKGYPQKKGVNPSYCYHCQRIKYVKDVSCVDHLSCRNLVTNVPIVAPDLPVGARLHQFWGKWAKW